MKVTWLGHACFKIEKNGYVAVIDPYTDGSVPGLRPVRERAHVVLCSHGHGDHHGTACVEVTPAEAASPFVVELLDTYHDEVQGAKRGRNQVIILDDGETKLAHLGDLGCDLEPEQKEKLRGVDVLLVPVGGYYTIDAAQAAALVAELKPRLVIPMHYRDDVRQIGFDEIATVADFTEQMDSVMTVPASELDTAAEWPAQVAVLVPGNAEKTIS